MNCNTFIGLDKIWQKAAASVKGGDLAVIPTDTIYGLVASAVKPKAVARLYDMRPRDSEKPCVVLCSSVKSLYKLGIKIDLATNKLLSKIWPNAVSVILPCPDEKFSYLHRGTKTLAVRIPKSLKLRRFLEIAGPIIAPSANPEGKTPAKNIKEAKKYFGDKVDVYISGKVSDKPSTLIRVEGGKIEILRQGAWKVSKKLIGGIQ